MEEKFILDLIKAFDSSSAVSMKLKQGETSITLKKEEAFFSKNSNVSSQIVTQVIPVDNSSTSTLSSNNVIPAKDASVSSEKISKENFVEESSSTENIIKSPIVGTFYRAPSPDAPVYCEVGKSIKKGQPICILEAMKMMNTLEAEFDCVIEEILVANGELVEFNQPIFKVKKV